MEPDPPVVLTESGGADDLIVGAVVESLSESAYGSEIRESATSEPCE